MTNQEKISALLEATPKGLLINGEWRDASDGGTFDVENPATGEVLATLASATEEDSRAAMDAAANAQESWARTSTRERSDILMRAYNLVKEHTDELATLMTLEMGKPLKESQGEVAYGNQFMRWFSEEAPRHYGRYADTPEGNLKMIVTHKPVGPCLLITPWNFPLAMATRKVAPAVAAGCTMILKPARLTPLTSQYFAKLMIEAGIPAGVLNVVCSASASKVSGPIMDDPRLRKVSFTGSTPVGKQLMKTAADRVLRTSMELGGNGPFIVFEDADLDKAVEGAMAAKMRNMGEACTAANRLYVQRSVADEFSRRLAERLGALSVGDGLAEGVQVGPLVEPKALRKVQELVDDAVQRGAEVICGGSRPERPGYFYRPTVLSGVDPSSRLMGEEIFGPVAPVIPFDTEKEAIALANDTPWGLSGYLFTQDLDRAFRVGEAMEVGMVGLNTGIVSNPAAPFGGIKASGLGREGSKYGIEDYLEIKYLCLGI